MFCFFRKGTPSGTSSALLKGLFLVTGLGDGGASFLFLTTPLLVIMSCLSLGMSYPRNCLKFSSVTRLSKSTSSKLSSLTLTADYSLIFLTSSWLDTLSEGGSLRSGRNNCQVRGILQFSGKRVPSGHSHSPETQKNCIFQNLLFVSPLLSLMNIGG
jgi:hypothetical protein